ncbi:SWI/SNF2 family helicase [Chloriridovirus anopheles1]|uniref:SWI/SNF2 family helicase n=1 Tax=Chloriridovirus anopheles1 TaxID=1465751 RepID=W8QN18_9VIRU|nr:SWI/SNF2 family helicase [Anopheles minimus iridovirus]AHL67578.1 SWI/SNF2 family helicase [Anopheles minimus iridovirus]
MFDKDINSLTEFVNCKLPKEELFPQHPGDLMLHQKLISTFINPHTNYDGLLLVHEMGTGKTCTAVSVAEEFIQVKQDKQDNLPSTMLKKIVVLTRGEGLQTNFINEIANVCTHAKYLEGIEKYTKGQKQFKRIRKNVKVNYTFDTFEVFAKTLSKTSEREKLLTFENTLFIIDEAHNLKKSDEKSNLNVYFELSKLFDSLQNRKILLLTGTPMKDQPEEIIDLMNLILRENKLEKNDLNNLNIFKQKVKGYVSYLRAMASDIDRDEIGKLIGTLQHLKVYPVVMDDFQTKYYNEAKIKDEAEKSIFNYSRQAALFVFPDGSYGSQGFRENIVQTSTGYKFKKSSFATEIRANLVKYSTKYNDLIQKLADDYDNNRSSFVFSEFVKGSGLIVLSLILELNGYTRAVAGASFKSKRKRYAIFTNETSSDAQTRALIAEFNHPRNIYGEYISTILGSRVIMEGFSFKNIQSEYILTPHWNYSETSQIIARGLRLGSHNDLLKAGITPKVSIYHYVAVLQDRSESIDLHMYQISEPKDFAIQKIIRALKECAFDCELNKDRNEVVNPNLDGTRACEYTNCNYQCDNKAVIEGRMDPRNYKLLYFRYSREYQQLKAFVIERVSQYPTTFEEISAAQQFSEFEIYSVLKDLIHSKEILFTRPDGVYYLFNTRNIFYAATHAQETEDPYITQFYTRYTTVFKGKSIQELVSENQKKFMVSLIQKLFKSQNLAQLQQYMVQLPLYLQEKLLLNCITSSEQNLKDKEFKQANFVRDMVLNNFRLYYRIESNKAFVWLNPDAYKCKSNISNGYWKLCSSSEKQQIEDMKKGSTQQKISNNPYGYIGLLNRTSNDFCLRKIEGDDSEDKRKRNVGKRCQNWKKKDLVDLVANRLKVVPDEDFAFDQKDVDNLIKNPKFKDIVKTNGVLKDYKRMAFWNAQDINYLCQKVFQTFMDKKLVIDDPNCGTSRKIR